MLYQLSEEDSVTERYAFLAALPGVEPEGGEIGALERCADRGDVISPLQPSDVTDSPNATAPTLAPPSHSPPPHTTTSPVAPSPVAPSPVAPSPTTLPTVAKPLAAPPIVAKPPAAPPIESLDQDTLLEHIRKGYNDDAVLQAIVKAKKDGLQRLPFKLIHGEEHLRLELGDCQLTDGLLFVRNKVYVPASVVRT